MKAVILVSLCLQVAFIFGGPFEDEGLTDPGKFYRLCYFSNPITMLDNI